MLKRDKGLSLVAVVVFAFIFAIVGYGILKLAEMEAILTRIDVDKTRAFYLAEAGLAKMQEKLQKPVAGDLNEVLTESIEGGSYRVTVNTSTNPCFAVATGISGSIQKRIRVKANFLAAPFENAIYASNMSGGAWAFQLRGQGTPVASGGREKGGRDAINGNIFVNGDVFMYEQSSVNPAPAPNLWNLHGDVSATGDISVFNSASISGQTNPDAAPPQAVDMTAMDYANNNTHNVSQIFSDAGVSSGYLPAGNPLRDIFVKNPSDRSAECGTTSGDDYFLEPVSVTGGGTQKDAPTPLHLGDNRVYYVDGDVWVHSKPTYGFTMDGKITIVVTGNIHICDNILYANENSILGLVALGKYDSSGNLISGGDIFFGDPRYGTMYVISAMMFAAHDFLYNANPVDRQSAEPTTGFTVNGSFSATDKVVVERDWYTQTSTSTARPAKYNSATGQWVDSLTGADLTSTEVGTIRHYQMIANYDSRVRNQDTQPPGLPRGGTKIFAGFSNWEEL